MSEKNEIVVVIVGAGPAGIATAIELKKNSNFEVIILEKNLEISYKVCAGGIDADLSKLGLPKEIIDRIFRRVKMFTPRQKVIIEEKEAIAATVDRKTLHFIILQMPKKWTQQEQHRMVIVLLRLTRHNLKPYLWVVNEQKVNDGWVMFQRGLIMLLATLIS